MRSVINLPVQSEEGEIWVLKSPLAYLRRLLMKSPFDMPMAAMGRKDEVLIEFTSIARISTLAFYRVLFLRRLFQCELTHQSS